MSTILQHYLNPLHLFCRLRGLGLAKTPAIFLCQFYERTVFNNLLLILLRDKGKLRFGVERRDSTEPLSNGSWLK